MAGIIIRNQSRKSLVNSRVQKAHGSTTTLCLCYLTINVADTHIRKRGRFRNGNGIFRMVIIRSKFHWRCRDVMGVIHTKCRSTRGIQII